MAVPEELRAAFPVVSSSALPPVTPRHSAPVPDEAIAPHRHNPQRDVRAMPAFQHPSLPPPAPLAYAHAQPAPTPRRQAELKPAERRAIEAAALAAIRPRSAWWEDPVALGSLLILVPPIGLAAVWSSKRYSSDARWALTVMTALMMCLVCAVTIAALVMR